MNTHHCSRTGRRALTGLDALDFEKLDDNLACLHGLKGARAVDGEALFVVALRRWSLALGAAHARVCLGILELLLALGLGLLLARVGRLLLGLVPCGGASECLLLRAVFLALALLLLVRVWH